MFKAKFLLPVAAAAGLCSFVSASPANAACLATAAGNNCATFNGTSISNAVYNGFTDAGFTANSKITSIHFDIVGLTSPLPLTLTGLEYSFDGTNFTTLNGGTYTFNGPAPQDSNDLLGGVVQAPGGVIGSNFTVRANLPAGTYTPLSGSRFIRVNIDSNNASDTLLQTQTRTSTPVAPPQVPGPLPLLGAGAAFGWSRRLRRQLQVAA